MLILSLVAASLLAAEDNEIREISYGDHNRQRFDLALPAENLRPAPILFFVHGGGWVTGDKRHASAHKGEFLNSLGWAYVAPNYRLVPEVKVEQQAEDLAAAIAKLRAEAPTRGLDPDRIVLMGHSAGAHLVALLATDRSYLRAEGIPDSAIDGVILLDGAGYDVPSRMKNRVMARALFTRVFGKDPVRQAALSPVTHVGGGDVPQWLILYVEGRPENSRQAQVLQGALNTFGAQAEALAIRGETHRSMNQELGLPDEETTRLVRDFLDRLP